MTGATEEPARAARSPDPVRAGILIDHPIPYIAPGLRELARHPELAARVYYWDDRTGGHDPGFGRAVCWGGDLRSGYDWWLPASDPAVRRRDTALRRGRAVLRQLRQDRPEVLLSFGWHSPVARCGLLHARRGRTPLLYFGDTHPDFSATGRWDRVRPTVLRALFRWAAGAVVTGHANRQFYLQHGMGPDQLHSGVLPADVERFAAAAAGRRPAEETPTADRPLVIAWAGKCLPRKGVPDLLRAAARLPAESPWQLWLIGDGPQRPELERQLAEAGLADRVRLLGFRARDELPGLLARTDVFVLPSRQDFRPLVVLEAMTAGAAVVISSANGLWGPGDVVRHNETGLVYPAGDVPALAASLTRLLADDQLRGKLATAGQARARWCGPGDFAATAAAALCHTVREHRRADGR